MNKQGKRARFEAMGGREGIAKRIMEIAKEIVEVGSYKRAVVGAGQMQHLAELCEADNYWDEKASYGHQLEFDIANGCRKRSINANGNPVDAEVVTIVEKDREVWKDEETGEWFYSVPGWLPQMGMPPFGPFESEVKAVEAMRLHGLEK